MSETPIRVLVVDDSDVDRRIVAQALAHEGWRVDEAVTGGAAVDMARANDYDAVVLDFALPDSDGVTVIERMRGGPHRSPVVVLSGSESPEVAERFIEAGAADFVSKQHISSVRLVHSVRQALLLREVEVKVEGPPLSAPRAPRGEVPIPGLGAPPRKGGRLLLVDDSDDMRFLLKRKLEPAGWSVTEAATGAQARQALQEGAFDLVLLDYLLPDTNGLALLGELRAAGLTAPVIALTAHGDERVAEALLRGGAADFLTKDGALWARLTLAVENVARVFGGAPPRL